MTTGTSSLPKRGLKRVEIEGLFGRYDYDLPRKPDVLSEVAILYGDNGSGKTTILTLLFHLLSERHERRSTMVTIMWNHVSSLERGWSYQKGF